MKFQENYSFDAKSIKKYFNNQTPGSPSETELYTDLMFPANNNSLMALDTEGIPLDQVAYDKEKSNMNENETEWKRISEIFGQYELFVGKIEMDDIKQGSLGNCYFLSALAALAQYPVLISNLFRTEKNRGGYYEVILFVDGEWQVIIVDDYFPVSKKDNNLIFCKPNLNEIWAILLEKAWAKINGGYLNTIGGLCGEVLQVITGAPYLGVSNSQLPRKKLWDLLYRAYKNNYIIGTGTIQCDWLSNLGLVPSHAYSVLQLEEFSIDGNLHQIIKLRNPWGNTEWNGDWSDSSQLWSEELKTKYNLKVDNDGSFWMSFDEYIRFYDQADIAYLQFDSINHGHVIEDLDTLKHPLVYRISVNTKTNIAISVISKQLRFNRKIKDVKRGFTCVVASLNYLNEPVNLVIGGYSTRDSLSFLAELDPGEYYIFIHCAGVLDPLLSKLSVKFSLDSFASISFIGIDKEFEILRDLTQKKIQEEFKHIYEKKEHCITEVKEFIEKYGVLPIYLKNNRRKPGKFTVELFMNFGVVIAPVYGKYYDKNQKMEISLGPHKDYAILLVAGQICYIAPTIGLNNSNFEILPVDSYIHPVPIPEIIKVETGNTFSYYIYSANYSKMSMDYNLVGSMSLDELHSTNKLKEKYYEILKEWNPHPDHIYLNLIWTKTEFDGKSYIGQIDSFGKPHGIGLLKENYQIYCGYFEKGVKEIKGKVYDVNYYTEDLQLNFDVEFKNNKPCGMGKYYLFSSSPTFFGMFENGIKVEGFELLDVERIWKGTFENDKKHGVGVLYFKNENAAFKFEYEWDDAILKIPFSADEARNLGYPEVTFSQQDFVIPE